jgi:rhodanese-related sulfurtransferase
LIGKLQVPTPPSLQPNQSLTQLPTETDVREPSEYTAGYIPTAINLPIKSQPDALFLPAEEFLDRFGFSKPSADQEVVFYCKAGVRSQAAAGLARQVGYTKVSEYRGSWMDWEKNGGEVGKA